MPEVLYWGHRLKEIDNPEAMATALSRPLPQTCLDQNVPFGLSPEHSAGFFGAPGLEGSHQGKGWAPKFQVAHIDQSNQHLRITCSDSIAGIEQVIELAMDQKTDVIKYRALIRNTGGQPYSLLRLANTLPLPHHTTELMTFNGRWCKEFQTARHPLHQGVFLQENRRGRTSHEHFPGLIAGAPGFSEEQGDVYGFHLAWSGNHRLRAEVTPEGLRYFQAEELLQPGEKILEAKECYQTPWLYATFSSHGLNGMSRQFHDFVRNHILAWPEKNKARPVHLNTWEGIYFNHNPEYIRKMATSAAKMGVERFIIDDGWFRGRNNDHTGLGDWFLDDSKYPDGLDAVIYHVNELGMEFGLWFEPEMVNPDSELFRKHPDWVLGTDSYPQITERNQYVLNLQIPECFNYLLARLNFMLSRYDIRYIKWDMNRTLVQASHNNKPAAHGQTRAFYALVDKLRQLHPKIEIESCSSGGGRIDMEVLKRTHRFWTSDTNDPVERQVTQKGFSYFFPPEIMGAHIGTDISHTTGRRHSIAFRGVTALFGHMGMELDPASASEQQKSEFARYISLYKKYRSLAHSGDLVRFDYPDSSLLATGIISKDKKQAIITVAQLQARAYTLPLPLKISGLIAGQEYHIHLIDGENFDQSMKQLPAWIKKNFRLKGEILERGGLQLPVLCPESALLLQIEAV